MGFANKFLIIAIGIFSLGCSKDDDTNDSIAFENAVLMKIQTTGNVSLYYIENEELNEISMPGDYPKGYHIFEEGGEKFIKVFSYVGGTNPEEQTVIDWGNGDSDTLSYNVIRHSNGSVAISSVSYNGDPIVNDNENGIYYVTKD